MTQWTTNAGGRAVFTHEGWEVQIWGPEWPNSRISVESPDRGEQVEVSDGVAGCAGCDGEVVGFAEVAADEDALFAAYLASDAAACFVGQVFPVCGGWVS
jgi:hypothetical protein